MALEPQAHIVKDHVHAKKVEAHIADYQYIRAIPVESNLVVMEFTKPGFSAADYCARAYEEGLWIQPAPGNRVRLVFYKDITDEQTEQVLDILDRMEQWCASIASDVQG